MCQYDDDECKLPMCVYQYAIEHGYDHLDAVKKNLDHSEKMEPRPLCTLFVTDYTIKDAPRKLDSVQHRAAKVIIGAVSSTNNEKAEQKCGLPQLESRCNLVTIKFTNELHSYNLDHISRRVFDKWKHSKRFKGPSTIQLDSQIRKDLNLKHSTLEFLQEPLIKKKHQRTPVSNWNCRGHIPKKEDPVTLRYKGLETIEILSQDNFVIAYFDGSSDRSLSNGGAGILILLPDGNNYKHKINTGIISSNFTSELMVIREALILYQQDPHVIDSTE
ncbi:RNase H domain-containing protein [Trichonephila clavipes]|nr:RNase H domain-containing protein [Trichonephila clavipes]